MNARRGLGALLSLVLVVAAAALGAGRAGAVPVPMYNEPAGGGAIDYQTFKIGPLNLDPMGTGHWQDEANQMIPRPSGAFGMKSMTFDLVDADGNPLDRHGVHLHHFVIASVFHKDPVCPTRKASGAFVDPFAGTGAERTPILMPDPYVLPVKADTGWGATWHIMNMTMEPKEVYIQYKIGVQPGATPTNSRYLTSYFMDVVPCSADAVFDVPGDGGPGSIYAKSTKVTIPKAGIVVGTGGHLHDGGINTVLTHQDGSVICDSRATYMHGNMIDQIIPCAPHDTVAAGEVLELTANYDNSVPWEDVMGINITYIWHGDQGPMPTTTTTTAAPTTTTPGDTGGQGNQQGATTTTTAAPSPTTSTPSGTSRGVTTAAPTAQAVQTRAALAG